MTGRNPLDLLDGVQRRYGNRLVLEIASLEVNEGETLCIRGRGDHIYPVAALITAVLASAVVNVTSYFSA